MVKCLLLNDSTKVQIILLIKKRGSRKLNFAFYCGFIWSIQKKAVLLWWVKCDRYFRSSVRRFVWLRFRAHAYRGGAQVSYNF